MPINKKASKITLSDKVAIIGIVVTIIFGIVAFITPEIRQRIGLDRVENISLIEYTTTTPENTLTPSSARDVTQQPELLVAELLVLRHGDAIAICTEQYDILTTLEVEIGINYRYKISNEITSIGSSSNNTCWCLVSAESHFDAPPQCNENNTLRQANATILRNETIRLSLNSSVIGTCTAQPDELAIYSCLVSLSLEG
jgi:hypothetical protein